MLLIERHCVRHSLKVFIHYYLTGNVFFYWMALVCLAYVYNVVAIPLRASFEWYAERGLVAWLLFDYLCDLVYLLDIVVVQCHLSYINNGTLEVCVCVCVCVCWDIGGRGGGRLEWLMSAVRARDFLSINAGSGYSMLIQPELARMYIHKYNRKCVHCMLVNNSYSYIGV